LRFTGTHEALGRVMGAFRRHQIKRSVDVAHEVLAAEGASDAELHDQIAPYIDRAAKYTPTALSELQGMAVGADVEFDTLFRLNCMESRPPGSAFLWNRPGRPTVDPISILDPDTVDTGIPPDPSESPGPGGCTSLASRLEGGCVVGHTEDSSPENIDGIYFLDATVSERAGMISSRFQALNYAMSIAGCAAAVNGHGLMILIDALPDPDRHLGVPRSCVSRVLLDQQTIEGAIDVLRSLPRGSGWNYLMVQGPRIVNVETTATTVEIDDATGPGTYVHTNHYRTPHLAARAGEPRPNSIARLDRALALVRRNMDLDAMRETLADREGFPDSICRERTIATWMADTARRTVQVCWGEPVDATWSSFDY
jgi:isopenicillin-N N-acyltransferase-like protein